MRPPLPLSPSPDAAAVADLDAAELEGSEVRKNMSLPIDKLPFFSYLRES